MSTTDHTGEYKYACVEDGWAFAHRSIERYQKELLVTVKSLDYWLRDEVNPTPVPTWAKNNIVRFNNWLHDYIHHHHEAEELIGFPVMQKYYKAEGMDLPAKLTTDHPGLLKQLDEIKEQLERLQQSKTVEGDRELQGKLIELMARSNKDMAAHFAEEEGNLPTIRRVTPQKAYKAMEDKIVSKLSKAEAGCYFWAMTPEQRTKVYKNFGIPAIGVLLGIKPAIKHFENTVFRNLMEVRANAHGLFAK